MLPYFQQPPWGGGRGYPSSPSHQYYKSCVLLLSEDLPASAQIVLDGAKYPVKVHPVLEDVDHLAHGPERHQMLLLSYLSIFLSLLL